MIETYKKLSNYIIWKVIKLALPDENQGKEIFLRILGA